jgi:O-antigen ligase
MIGLAVGLLAALGSIKSAHRFRLIGAGVVLVAMFLGLADPEFISRQQTSKNFETESTAVERFASWKGGLNLIKDHPFGAGGSGYFLLSSEYIRIS